MCLPLSVVFCAYVASCELSSDVVSGPQRAPRTICAVENLRQKWGVPSGNKY